MTEQVSEPFLKPPAKKRRASLPNKIQQFARVCAALCLAASTSVFAAGLGKGQLNSLFGQSLDAQFEILTKADENVSERCFRLSPPIDRERNSEDILRGEFSMEKVSAERTLLRLKSSILVQEPVISITVKLDCGGGVLLRRYTFLPDLIQPAKNADLPSSAPDGTATITPPSTINSDALAADGFEVRRTETPRSLAKERFPDQPERQRAFVRQLQAENKDLKLQPHAEIPLGSRLKIPAPTSTSRMNDERDAPAPTQTETQTSTKVRALAPALAKPSDPRRRTGKDRISLNAHAPAGQDGIDHPLQLRLSPLLDMSRAGIERSTQELAIADLERRLADLNTGAENHSRTPEQRLQALIGLLGEAQAIAGQVTPPINLPKVNEIAAAPPSSQPPVPTEKPKPASAKAPENILSGENIGLLVALIIVAAGTAAILWVRARTAAPIPLLSRQDEALSEEATSPEPLARNNDIFRKPEQAEPVQAVMEPLRESVSSISVSHGFEQEYDDPFTAHLEAAEIMICFGRYQSAAAEVLAYIDESPDCGLRPRLALLDIYRRGDMKAAFEATVSSLSGQFNVALPEWKRDQDVPLTARNLDDFPHLIARISELWESDECLPYIQHLTTDTRGGTRSGFDIDAAEELALLEAMLRLRGKDALKVPEEIH